MGIRLRLRELLDIAVARNEGASLEHTVSGFQTEARNALAQESSFLNRRHGETAKQLRQALKEEKDDPLPAHGLNFSAIEAALLQLDSPGYLDSIIDELCARADTASDFGEMDSLDEIVELMDAELAYEGHSPEWRLQVAQATQEAISEGTSLKQAVNGAIEASKRGWPKTIRILVPVRVVRTAATGSVSRLLEADDVNRRLAQWLDGGSVPDEFRLDDHGFNFDIEGAADKLAAAARANDWLEQELAFYSLHGGSLEVADDWLLVEESGQSEVVVRPVALSLLPDGLNLVEKTLSSDPTKPRRQRDGSGSVSVLPDALVQLAQARRGPAGAALSDIWTVVEAVFAGAATERRYLAGEVMAELMEYLYPLALLDWMGNRLEAAGLGKPDDGQTPAAWALDQFDKNPSKAFGISAGDKDPLLFMRSKAFGKWSATAEPSERMEKDLSQISTRCSRVASRAYLVRNFQLHRAQPYRAAALTATLPVFAEIAREALGYIVRVESEETLPITSAKLALMRIRQVVWDFKTGDRTGAEPLRSALGSDLR